MTIIGYFQNSDGIKINCENPGINGDIQIKNAASYSSNSFYVII